MAFAHRYVTFFNQSLRDTGLMPFVERCIKLLSMYLQRATTLFTKLYKILFTYVHSTKKTE